MKFFRLFTTSANTITKPMPEDKNSVVQGSKQIKYSFEEFKLYYESTEKVTDRRIANNNLNYSICVAVLIAIGYLWNWSIDHPKYSYPSLTLVCLLAIVAMLYTQLWLAQIRDYKRLNTAKFEVLNEMAPNIAFSEQKFSSEVDIISSKPFEKEWDKVKDLGGLQNKRRFNIIALKSSNQEYFVPQALFTIFILTAIATIFSFAFHFGPFIGQWKNFLQI